MNHHQKADHDSPRFRSDRRSTRGPVTATWLMFTLVTTVFTLVMAVIVAMPGQAGADSQQIAQI